MPQRSERESIAHSLLTNFLTYHKLREKLRMQQKRRARQFLRRHISKTRAETPTTAASTDSDVSLTSSSGWSSSTGNWSTSDDDGYDGDSDESTSDWSSDSDLSSSSSSSLSLSTHSDSSNRNLGSFTTSDSAEAMSVDSGSDWSDSDDDDGWNLGPQHFLYGSSLSRRVRQSISALYAKRYWKGTRGARRRSRPAAHLVFVLRNSTKDPALFRRELRVNPATFEALVQQLESDSIFINKSSNDQIPVSHQLAITLYRFGHFGNSAGLHKAAQWSGYGKGTVVLATRRVMTAVLRPQFLKMAVHLPTDQEKEEAKEWVERKSCKDWRDGWCFVDGTLILLYARPHWYGESYFDRKCNYSLNLQVCDHSYIRYPLLTILQLQCF